MIRQRQSCVELILENNYYSLSNSLLWGEDDKSYFYSYTKTSKDERDIIFDQSEKNLLIMNIMVDKQEDFYERSYYSFWDFIGQLGGIYEIFHITIGFVVGYYNSMMMSRALLNQYNNLGHETYK